MKNYSQNNEQEVIFNFIDKNNLTQGKLLEIGAFDGESFSNVRGLMLKYPSWKGVFVEPSSYCFSKLVDLYKMEPRRAILLNLAIVPENELDDNSFLKFYESPMSAVSSSIEGHVQRWAREKNSDGDWVNPREIYVGKIGMKEILEKFGPFEMISIDVEGYSAKLALQDWFNPSNYNCKIIVIEHDNRVRELQEKFFSIGYSLNHINNENIIFQKVTV